jgi:ABC-type branched-subunit amino acid transport system permease subunit
LNPEESGLPIGFPTIGSWVLQTPTELYVLALIVFGGVAFVLSRLRGSTSGMELAAIRSKSQRAASLGIRASRLRISSFVGAAFIAGIGGGLVASTQQVALPITYSTTSALVWFAVAMLMGIESIGGALVAGLGIWLAPTLISAYLTPTWANALPVLFGVGAISIAKRGVGMVPHFRHLLRSLAARIEKRVGSQPAEERTSSLAGDGPLRGGGMSEGAVAVGSSGGTGLSGIPERRPGG